MSTTTARRKITNVCAVGIVYRAQDPSQIFIEVKDDGYPIPLGRRQLCLIGGNWIGLGAVRDTSPLATFKREFSEELSFEKSIRSTEELIALGLADTIVLDQVESSNIEPTDEDRETLALLKEASLRARPFIDRINTVTRKALESADPKNKRDEFVTLSSYHLVPLNEKLWQRLVKLQNKFGNISNESVTLVTSLDEIIKKKFRIFAGHDRVLQGFFLAMGFERAKEMTIVPDITSEIVGSPLSSYHDYITLYDVAKRPLMSLVQRDTKPNATDTRRDIFDILDKNFPGAKHVNAIVFKERVPGKPWTVGQHWHNDNERFRIAQGRLPKLVLEDIELKDRLVLEDLGPGTIIEIPARVAHSFLPAPGLILIGALRNGFNDKDLNTYPLMDDDGNELSSPA